MKKFISALMAMAMCISAVPMAVCAENNTNSGHLEFTQKLCDECLLDPEESEENRLIYNYVKAHISSNYDEFLGVYKRGEGSYASYSLGYVKNKSTVPGHEDIKCSQHIFTHPSISAVFYSDNPHITEEEFNALSSEEKFITSAKIFDETGENISSCVYPAIYIFPIHVGEDGKGYSNGGKEMDIVDGKMVSVPDIIVDEAEKRIGDANVDGDVNMADAVLIMQSLSNPNEYKLSEQGLINADYNDDGGVTALDALEIQISMIS